MFELTPTEAQAVMVESKGKYKEIIRNLPEFEKGDRFQMNIVGCVMLGALVQRKHISVDTKAFA